MRRSVLVFAIPLAFALGSPVVVAQSHDSVAQRHDSNDSATTAKQSPVAKAMADLTRALREASLEAKAAQDAHVTAPAAPPARDASAASDVDSGHDRLAVEAEDAQAADVP